MKDYSAIEGIVQNARLLLETAFDRGRRQQAKEDEPETVSDIIESVKVEICDKYCKKPDEIKDEADLIEVCEKCPLGRLG